MEAWEKDLLVYRRKTTIILKYLTLNSNFRVKIETLESKWTLEAKPRKGVLHF